MAKQQPKKAAKAKTDKNGEAKPSLNDLVKRTGKPSAAVLRVLEKVNAKVKESKGADAEPDDFLITANSPIIDVDSIPTGIATLDKALGIGGLPRGRIVELFGIESSGKTTTIIQAIKSCQQTYFPKFKRYGLAAFIDVEHALDPNWAEAQGVDLNNLIFYQPTGGEDAMQRVKDLVETNEVDLIAIDSIAGLVPKEELNGEIADVQIGAQARLLSKSLRVLNGPIKKSNVCALFVNQIRMKVGQQFGNPEETPGGRAMKFYASVRMDVRRGSLVGKGGKFGDEAGRDGIARADAIGIRTRIKIIKNKMAPPFRGCEFSIIHGMEITPGTPPVYGVDVLGSLFELATAENAIRLGGSNYYWNFGTRKGKMLGVGRVKALNNLRDDAEGAAALLDHLMSKEQSSVNIKDVPAADLPKKLVGGEDTEAEPEGLPEVANDAASAESEVEGVPALADETAPVE